MRALLACAVMLSLLSGVTSQAGTLPLGVRTGFSQNPDQFIVGAHGRIDIPLVGWTIVPVLELGWGDNVKTFAVSGDMIYTFPELQTPEWGWYVGGGLGFANYSYDVPETAPVDFDETSSEFGLNLVAGITKNLPSGHRLSLETRFGIGDLPDLKITAGYSFF